MPKSLGADGGFGFLTRKQIAAVLKVPQRMVDQLIATGQITPIRMSLGLGRGGQRIFYSAADVRKLKLERGRSKLKTKKDPPKRTQ
jgi:hypothetical protein